MRFAISDLRLIDLRLPSSRRRMAKTELMRPSIYALLFLSFLIACSAEQQIDVPEEKLSEAATRLPENALAGLSIGRDLEAQLFAAEPLVRNPSNIDVDHRGRVWVVENVNYRPENNPDNP